MQVQHHALACLVTSQNVTAPKPCTLHRITYRFSYQSECHCAKTVVYLCNVNSLVGPVRMSLRQNIRDI